MMSEWRMTSNLIAGEKHYSCYRLKDVEAVDHSGNREELVKTNWNPLAYVSDYGWTCIVCVAGAAFAVMVLAG